MSPVVTFRWRDEAACRDADYALFFPPRGVSAEPARKICAGCPVRQPCLDFANHLVIEHGIWGGLTDKERRPLRSGQVAAVQRERDAEIREVLAGGRSKAAAGREFGLAPASIRRVLARAEAVDKKEVVS